MKVKVWARTSKVKSLVERVIEVDDEYFDDSDLFDGEAELKEQMHQEMSNMITWGWEIVK